MALVMTIGELEGFLAAEFPQVFHPESGLAIETLWDGGCRVRQAFRAASLRPGGTISGPTLMALADFTMYVAVLAAIGPVPLAVTINLNINFLRRPGPHDVVAEGRLLKLGKRLATGEVTIRCDGDDDPVAHAQRPIRSRRMAGELGRRYYKTIYARH
jgi:uncharacterized protein (TIGR00369 family)